MVTITNFQKLVRRKNSSVKCIDCNKNIYLSPTTGPICVRCKIKTKKLCKNCTKVIDKKYDYCYTCNKWKTNKPVSKSKSKYEDFMFDD